MRNGKILTEARSSACRSIQSGSPSLCYATMTTLFQESSLAVDRSLSFGFDGPGRPRAATVSFRYNVPQSPIYKPSVSPPHSPPSLILPPVGLRSGGLSRSFSRLSCLDERLASSAPSTSHILFQDPEGIDLSRNGPSQIDLTNDVNQNESPSEFTLLEEEDLDHNGGFFAQRASSSKEIQFPTGTPGTRPSMSLEGSSIEAEFNSFSASPVLISCLRDIAKTRRSE